jgi:hypothetical protein
MSDSNMPIQPLYDELEAPPMVGWVVHLTEGKPQSTQNQTFWAWCKVEADKPGYTEIVFTEADGTTPADPYPVAPGGTRRPVRLGTVLFKVFC